MAWLIPRARPDHGSVRRPRRIADRAARRGDPRRFRPSQHAGGRRRRSGSSAGVWAPFGARTVASASPVGAHALLRRGDARRDRSRGHAGRDSRRRLRRPSVTLPRPRRAVLRTRPPGNPGRQAPPADRRRAGHRRSGADRRRLQARRRKRAAGARRSLSRARHSLHLRRPTGLLRWSRDRHLPRSRLGPARRALWARASRSTQAISTRGSSPRQRTHAGGSGQGSLGSRSSRSKRTSACSTTAAGSSTPSSRRHGTGASSGAGSLGARHGQSTMSGLCPPHARRPEPWVAQPSPAQHDGARPGHSDARGVHDGAAVLLGPVARWISRGTRLSGSREASAAH